LSAASEKRLNAWHAIYVDDGIMLGKEANESLPGVILT
jgi:hypothetical protein